jgi:hypothetical protein
MILARMDMRDSVIELLSSRVTNNCSGVGLTCLTIYFSTSTIVNSAIRVADSAVCSTCAGNNVLFQATQLRNSSFIVENSYLDVNSTQNTAYSLLFYGGSTLTQSAVSIRNSAFIASGLTAWNYYAVTSSGMFEGSQLLFENVNATAIGTNAAANIVSFTDSPTDQSRVNVTGSSLISYGDVALALFRFVASGLVNGSECLVQDTTIVSSSNGTSRIRGAFRHVLEHQRLDNAFRALSHGGDRHLLQRRIEVQLEQRASGWQRFDGVELRAALSGRCLRPGVVLNRSTAVVFGSSPTTQMNVGLQKVACMNSSVLVHATMMIAEGPAGAAANICILRRLQHYRWFTAECHQHDSPQRGESVRAVLPSQR